MLCEKNDSLHQHVVANAMHCYRLECKPVLCSGAFCTVNMLCRQQDQQQCRLQTIRTNSVLSCLTPIQLCRKLRVLSIGVSASKPARGWNLSCMTASKRWARLSASNCNCRFSSFVTTASCSSSWLCLYWHSRMGCSALSKASHQPSPMT